MNTIIRCILLVATVTVTSPLVTQQPASGTLLILSSQDQRIIIVDTNNLRVLTTLPVGLKPRQIALSTDARIAYISHEGHTITPVDLVSGKLLATIHLGGITDPQALTYAGGHLWFLAGNAVERYSPTTHTIDRPIGTAGVNAQTFYVEANEEHIITADSDQGTLTLYDHGQTRLPRRAVSEMISGGTVQHPGLPPLNQSPAEPAQMPWQTATVAVGRGVKAFAVAPNGREIWVANAQNGNLSVIDRNSRAVVTTVPSTLPEPDRLVFTPDGARVLVSSSISGQIAIWDASTRALLKRIEVGHAINSLLIQPDGRRAYAACTHDNDVAVIDLQQLTVVQHIRSIRSPAAMAYAPVR